MKQANVWTATNCLIHLEESCDLQEETPKIKGGEDILRKKYIPTQKKVLH